MHIPWAFENNNLRKMWGANRVCYGGFKKSQWYPVDYQCRSQKCNRWKLNDYSVEGRMVVLIIQS